jgi:hypothetical protein
MVRIRRGAVSADRRARANGCAVVRVERIVALGAQRAKLAEAEQTVISAMWLDMVGNGRRRDAAGLEAAAAQGLQAQLMPASVLPFTPVVPAMHVTLARHSSVPAARETRRAGPAAAGAGVPAAHARTGKTRYLYAAAQAVLLYLYMSFIHYLYR